MPCRIARQLAIVVCAVAALGLAGCRPIGSSAGGGPAVTPVAGRLTAPPVTATAAPGQGLLVVLDPGHNGGNASHPAAINALVPAGRGERKACNTTGTQTDAGYPEHAFNWDVALRVRADLEAAGFRVVLTRSSDTGVGPCVDQRAAVGNDDHAAAVVAIHADGAGAGAHGFHVEYSDPPLNTAQGVPSVRLATALRDAGRSAGFATATYIGTDGLFGRADLAGLNLSDEPTALIECGNMRNAGDAAVESSATGRQRYADFIAAGIIAFLTKPS